MVGGFFSIFWLSVLSTIGFWYIFFWLAALTHYVGSKCTFAQPRKKKLLPSPSQTCLQTWPNFAHFYEFSAKNGQCSGKKEAAKNALWSKSPSLWRKKGAGGKRLSSPPHSIMKKRQAGRGQQGVENKGEGGSGKAKTFFLGASTLLEPSASRFWSAKATVHRQYCCWTASDTHFDFWGHLCWTISKNYKSFQPKKDEKILRKYLRSMV